MIQLSNISKSFADQELFSNLNFKLNPGNKIGLVTYELIGKQCEIVTLDAFVKFEGIGSALTEQVVRTAREQKCEREHQA